jgi:thiosulfate reductase cytochrome b subunit
MYLYPIWIRLWHLVNAILILILIVTGAMMLFTDTENQLLIQSFPGSVRLHDISAVILTISYMVFVIGNIISGNGKYYRINSRLLFHDSGRQLKYFVWGMFRKEKIPFPVTLEDKFNPLQKITYFLIMYAALPLLIISGIIMLCPDMKIISYLGAGFYVFTDILHIVLGFLITIFLVVHIYSCTISPEPGSIFRSIMSGYRESEEQ